MRRLLWVWVGLAGCSGSLNVGKGSTGGSTSGGGIGGLPSCGLAPDGGNDGGLGLQSGSPWPMYQAGPRLNGRAAAVGPAQPTAKWFVPGDFGQPSIAADGTVYAVNGRTLQAIHPDGTLDWNLAPLNADASEAFTGTPAIRADGSLIIGSGSEDGGGLYAIAASGCIEWVTPLADDASSSPAVAPNGAIYLATEYQVRAFRADGEAAWAATVNTVDTFGTGTPAVGPDGTIYAGGAGTGLSAFNGAGVAQWTTTNAYQAMLGDDGTIYVANRSALQALTPSGAQVWSVSFPSALSGIQPVSAADGTLFVEASGLVAVNPSGVEKWASALPEGNDVFWPPMVGPDGTVYVGTNDTVISTCIVGCDSATGCACGPAILGDGLQAILPDGGTAWAFAPNAAFTSPAMGSDGTIYVAGSWTSPDAGMPLAPPGVFGGLYALGAAP